MIKTKFNVKNIEAAIKLLIDFERKLKRWASKSEQGVWDIKVIMGDDQCTIIVTIDNEPKNNNNS